MVTNQFHWPLLLKEFLRVTNWLELIFSVAMNIYFSILSSFTAIRMSQLLHLLYFISELPSVLVG